LTISIELVATALWLGDMLAANPISPTHNEIFDDMNVRLFSDVINSDPSVSEPIFRIDIVDYLFAEFVRSIELNIDRSPDLFSNNDRYLDSTFPALPALCASAVK
jgi:hypothetical protein